MLAGPLRRPKLPARCLLGTVLVMSLQLGNLPFFCRILHLLNLHHPQGRVSCETLDPQYKIETLAWSVRISNSQLTEAETAKVCCNIVCNFWWRVKIVLLEYCCGVGDLENRVWPPVGRMRPPVLPWEAVLAVSSCCGNRSCFMVAQLAS